MGRLSKEELGKIQTERTLSDAELLKGGAKYTTDSEGSEPRLEITDQQYEKILQEMEEILGKDFLTRGRIDDGTVEIKIEKAGPDEAVGRIEYEFEIESESRYVIEPGNVENYDWKNHVVDTYDQSGRARVRIKNDKPRLSLKVPLFTKDTATSKTCLRLEFKPIDEQQEHDLMRIRELILKEAGAQISEKWGAPIMTKDGSKVYINRDSNNNWWIEVDEGVDFEPPEGVKVLRIEKSAVKTE
ncbi:MAG: hypothetical protein A3B91_04270 [Candidatus Yanofskybacteria bacterium RIFCSPHIGHO2_02_FULL_41_29]|uniref:Uncharacterized protein n=1 Tax=Candidatus Yanofskybacteria bacterium RIFCSPHIGHO2_01_FULL_41_53 TaxID=1802663 RepID=A0A1F8EHU6_9BACT|nr:MAG: hypothetical protein A2650_03530 [Candidatus Yanofskybacteria bacterium RIFCSPHIGHO2_01_FULL_41_53]OGN11739.1 MAG: hypothetical protein A3B91_04270 [Candidatus Yanofskybacteria bacterium RIFCSPHIGHO2_02_FULL_41_29]OGN17504.1 MAG: hypothetical protein A3F48_01830 [Candidatus Yanofskybacteria bacterium RIFCSPHIGHO2_12_FULL_41_9]OGN22893.1 MAG: hypothetical protein A2916_00725 [Candidatus Yanofskybacteria bacterium RIFCSPLOWO2_01_FULL_41_67]OGN30275.1 MAG: hypothetical protein A3H54_05125 